jgi:hypothetical protein
MLWWQNSLDLKCCVQGKKPRLKEDIVQEFLFAFRHCSPPRMKSPECSSHGGIAHACVNLRRCEIAVTEQLLNSANVSAAVEEMGSERVAESVGTDFFDSGTTSHFHDHSA